MKHEKSCGIIPFIANEKKVSVLIVKQNNGVIGFPKGHVENNESEEETALRECFEETNTKASIINGFREEISYYMPEYEANKTVVFFVGTIDKSDLKKQESEISDIKIMSVKEALKIISFDDTKKLLKKAEKFFVNLK